MATKKIYQQAMDIINQRRLEALSQEQIHRQEIEKKIPQIIDLERQLAACTIQLSKQVFNKHVHITEIAQQIQQKSLKIQMNIAEKLFEHGYDTNYLLPNYTCSVCCDTGFNQGIRCQCMITLIRQLTTDVFNQTSGLSLCSFDDFSLLFYHNEERQQMQQLFVFCVKYTKKFDPQISNSLLMMGNTGLGKTHLSLSIAKEVLAQGYHAMYIMAPDFFARVQQEHFGKAPPGQQTFASVMEADLLILDDLGAEYDAAFHTASFYRLLNTRLQMGKPMIISTNLTVPELVHRYGNRISSRLITLCKCLKFVGQDVKQSKLTTLK